jgi:transposase
MIIIGCDFHPSYQQLAMVDTGTGEWVERRLEHAGEEVKKFYAGLPGPVRVGMEATGYAQWFERLLGELGHELWVGDPAEIRARVVRKQKTDARDAQHLLDLLVKGDFPRIWVPRPEERDTRQLVLHRDRLVRLRTQVKNQLQALALGQGVRAKSRLWSAVGRRELEALALARWADRRRADLLTMLDELDPKIAELDGAVATVAAQRSDARRLMAQVGVGPVTALAFVLTVGPVSRFRRARHLVSYLGLNPREDSSGGKQRLGAISKQGNGLVRWLLVEAAQTAARRDAELGRFYRRLAVRRGRGIAKVAVARKLAVKLYWRLREEPESQAQPARMQGSSDTSLVDASPSS